MAGVLASDWMTAQRSVVRRLRFWTVLVWLSAIQLEGRAPQHLDVTETLNLYDRGVYAEVLKAIDRSGAIDRDLFPTFEKDANRWIGASSSLAVADSARRPLVAATVALELAHRLRDEPADRAGRYLVWASLLMRQHRPAVGSDAERLWHLAAVAGMEELDEPWVLTAGAATGSSVLEPLRHAMGTGGQLAVTGSRFPDEPRFKLAKVEASESPVFRTGLVPSRLEALRRGAAIRVPDDPRTFEEREAAGARNFAARDLKTLSQLAEVQRQYDALAPYIGIRAEVDLHLGYLESARGNSAGALEYLRLATSLADEDYLRYLSWYIRGRVCQNSGDHAAAIVAFEEAVRVVPNARAASTQLVVELLLSDRAGDRDQAYPLLQAAYSLHSPEDPWRLFGHGDARLWSTYIAQLRKELR